MKETPLDRAIERYLELGNRYVRYWSMACQYEDISPEVEKIEFSDSNPYGKMCKDLHTEILKQANYMSMLKEKNE